jgi:hypothetical protein
LPELALFPLISVLETSFSLSLSLSLDDDDDEEESVLTRSAGVRC